VSVRQTIFLAVGCLLFSLGGCSPKQKTELTRPDRRQDFARLATEVKADVDQHDAATAQPDLNVASVVSSDRVKLINFTDNPLENATVWLNGTHACRVRSVAPQGTVTLKKADFLDAKEQPFSKQDEPSDAADLRVTVELDGKTYTTLEPVKR
jgi:hypothetical protein